MCFRGLAVESALAGSEVINIPINMGTGAASGPARVERLLETTPFMILGADAAMPIDTYRRAVSGVLLLGGGSIAVPGRVSEILRDATGLLHPEPLVPFDRNLLRPISFLRLGDGWREGRAICEEA